MRCLLAVLFAVLFAYSPLMWATLYGMWIPMPNANANAGPSARLVDAAAEKYASCGKISKTCTLNAAGFLLSTINTGGALRVSFQDIDASGDADGSVDQFGDVTLVVGDSDKWIDTTTSPAIGAITSGGNGAGSGRSVTIGDTVCLVRDYSAFVAQSINFKSFETGLPTWDPAMNVYDDHFVASWTKQDTTPAFALGCNDGTWQYLETVAPYTNVLQQLAFNNGSAADEVALRFKIPFTGARLGKARIWTNMNGDADAVLYDGTTAIRTVSLDKDAKRSGFNWTEAQFQDEVLTANTIYRLALKPTTATSVTLNYNNVQSNPILDTVGGGREWYWSSRVDAGAWTDLTTRRPFINLMLTFADGSGGGAGASSYVTRLGPIRPGFRFSP